jgi:hypothetical protein
MHERSRFSDRGSGRGGDSRRLVFDTRPLTGVVEIVVIVFRWSLASLGPPATLRDASGVERPLMPVAQRGAEGRPVLQFADDAVEALIALQRDVLRVLIADGAELAIEIAVLNARTTQSTGGISVRGHV